MAGTLYLLDGMALIFRAHYALIRSPIRTSKGVDTSAMFGFTNTLLELLEKGKPTHIAVAFDTAAPTERHQIFPEYKAQREEMPEALAAAIPNVRRIVEAFRIPVIAMDGYEADDIIATIARRAEAAGFDVFMVTPDKDFLQLVTERVRVYRPGRQGSEPEVLGVDEVRVRWCVDRVGQVVDILGLMGDASDNVPGVPGIGEKTAQKLIAQFGSVEKLLAQSGELKGKVRESIEAHREQALLSKRLVTIRDDVPVRVELEAMRRVEPDEAALRALLVEFEFNALGRRLFGANFKAGRGYVAEGQSLPGLAAVGGDQAVTGSDTALDSGATLKTIRDVPHEYKLIDGLDGVRELVERLGKAKAFCFDTETDGLNPREARLLGLAFSESAGEAWYVALPAGDVARREWLEAMGPIFQGAAEKVGHNLKFDLGVLRAHGVAVRGPFFDTMVAHVLAEPGQRHGMDYLSEAMLGYAPIPITALIGAEGPGQKSMAEVPVAEVAEYAAEDADVTLRLRGPLTQRLKETGQERVFREVECPLIPVLVAIEHEGVAVDSKALEEYGRQLAKEIEGLEEKIVGLAGTKFNLNSPKQLGQILFDVLKLEEKPKRTKTGQYVTNEQVLAGLATKHEIAREILEHRAAQKLKSTYVDALPGAVSAKTGRVHTTFHQIVTTTGRLSSENPNLQNIPIRTERGREIRRAFVPRGKGWALMSADYSQIELRIMAHMSADAGLIEAFDGGQDIHTATAARVYGVPADGVTGEMRRKAKMVNFGIIYGISAFGLSQRLGIPRGEAAEIIETYFGQYAGVKRYMEATIAFAREKGYVETITGRRRYLRDINSANATARQAEERNAINTPIQGTAADMIKIAMTRVHEGLEGAGLKTRMILQVHDELVFDLHGGEEADVRGIVEPAMREAIALKVPVVVEIGVGENWLEAH